MNSNNRIIFNTIVLYAQVIINMLLSLWTVPLVLQALGQSDYGLYNLVAGIVVMLTFLNSSMTVVTQRYMSVTMGTDNLNELNNVYNASIRIHIILGISLVLVLEVLTPFLFDGFLNIETGRRAPAICLYQFMIVSTFFSIIAVPFDATLNAYEDMVVFSIISILEAFFKLLLALTLSHLNTDRLIFYGLGLAIISILGVLIRIFIVNKKYLNLRVNILKNVPKELYRDMLAYAGWNTFGSVAMIGKNQGIAVVLNLFRGTVINASFGIANQINGLLSSFTANIQKAVSPQLMKHQGAKRHDKMINMSFSLVKVATIVFSLFAVPVFIELDILLRWWLHGVVPEYTLVFCRLIIITQLLFQLSSGVALVIDAVGKIKSYRIVLSCALILNIPVAYLFMRWDYEPYMIIFSMIVIEIVCLIIRLIFARYTAKFPITLYIKECLLPLLIIVLLSMLGGLSVVKLVHPCFGRVILVSLITCVITCFLSYIIVMKPYEKAFIRDFFLSLLSKVGVKKEF